MVSQKDMKAAMKVLSEGLSVGQEVSLKGFGKFVLKQKPARTGRNPATGEAIQIPAKTVLKFVPTASFKSKISEIEAMEMDEDSTDD